MTATSSTTCHEEQCVHVQRSIIRILITEDRKNSLRKYQYTPCNPSSKATLKPWPDEAIISQILLSEKP
uniref:Uncharacterized protein n=1 Tax=Rhizophora mucronata TaxID=61149 RepID=A0A2P2PMY0_RHIMU